MEALFGDGLELPAGENVLLKAKRPQVVSHEAAPTKRKNREVQEFKCETCPRVFESAKGLGRHKGSCQGKKAAGKNRSSSWGHSGAMLSREDEWHCKPCGKNFASKVALEIHQDDHHGVKRVA